jgi:hypothetical protein
LGGVFVGRGAFYINTGDRRTEHNDVAEEPGCDLDLILVDSDPIADGGRDGQLRRFLRRKERNGKVLGDAGRERVCSGLEQRLCSG